ncbi:MAG: RAMP superfamily CRISPR-associated protein [Desulfobacca sp.]|nr:RAMP superfamily CRISPR-associated protein [Desulfobacca sp.]
MPPIERQLTITFSTPFRVGSGLGRGLGLDHTAVRDAEGLPYIPASTLKGRLRSLCKRVALTLAATDPLYKNICQTLGNSEACKPAADNKPCVICQLFGSRFWPGALRFSDGRLSAEQRTELLLRQRVHPGRFDPTLAQARTQIRINRRRGGAEAKFLFCGETLPEPLAFTARINIIADLDAPAEELLGWGVRLLTHLGAQKSRGLGQCHLSWL